MNTSPLNIENKPNRQFLSLRVDMALHNLASGEDKSILNFWGCPGGGRTTLLENFRSQLVSKENVSVPGIWDVNAKPIENTIAEIQDALDTTEPNKIKVILIDNLRALEESGGDNPTFLQFEHNLMATIVHRRDVLTLIISQHEIRQWHELVVRMRQQSYPIPPLSREEFDAEARNLGLDPDDAFQRCKGHPLPLEWIKEDQNVKDVEIDQRAANYFLKDLEKDVCEETRVLSLLIQFDEALMEKVLKSAGLARRKNYFALLETIRHMGFAGLIMHDSRSGMYRFTDPSVQQLLARGFRSENAAKAKEIHAMLVEYYKQACSRPATLHNFFVSAIYHMAWSANLNELNGAGLCKEWLETMRPAWRDANWKAVQKSWINESNSFVYAEVGSMLGNDICDHITGFITAQLEANDGSTDQ